MMCNDTFGHLVHVTDMSLKKIWRPDPPWPRPWRLWISRAEKRRETEKSYRVIVVD